MEKVKLRWLKCLKLFLTTGFFYIKEKRINIDKKRKRLQLYRRFLLSLYTWYMSQDEYLIHPHKL